MKIEHILLDMDGVLCDWSGAVWRLFDQAGKQAADWRLENYLGVTEQQMWEAVDAEGPYFWANLQEHPWYLDLMNLVSEYPWTLATSPSKDPQCALGKRLWMQEHYGHNFTSYMMGGQKWLMAGPGKVLIDDSDKNCDAFEKHGGQAIVFPQPWNSRRNVARAGLHIDYVRDRLKQITDGTIKDANWLTRINPDPEQSLVA